MEPPPREGRRFRFTIRTSFYNRPAIPRRKSERIPTRGPIAGRREYVVVLSSVGLRPAENASTACGGTMQPSAWSGCGLPLFGCGRRANLSKLYFSRPPACGIALQKQPNSHFGKHPAPPIRCLLQRADLPLLSPKGGAKSVRRAPLSGSDGGSP